MTPQRPTKHSDTVSPVYVHSLVQATSSLPLLDTPLPGPRERPVNSAVANAIVRPSSTLETHQSLSSSPQPYEVDVITPSDKSGNRFRELKTRA